MSDYARIAEIIEFLDRDFAEQPDLETLARRAGLSAAHFHRLFRRWAGITPKDFLQCLTLEHAKARLRAGESVLSASLAAGLSGPGRLHDLCVTLEAATPGELKSGGWDCELTYGFAQTPFGEWLAAENDRGICHVAFCDSGSRQQTLSELKASWPEAKLLRDDTAAARLASLVFQPGERKAPVTLKAFVRGTSFEIRVWRALLHIPAGTLTSYGRLAQAIGHPAASRAVGRAVGANPLALLIPCHRVIRQTALVGEYRWGSTRKQAMIAWESTQVVG